MAEPVLLSDYLAEALASLNRARNAIETERPHVTYRETVLHEIAEAEKSISRVIYLVSSEFR